MSEKPKYNDRIFIPIIWVLSVVIPLAVAVLLNPRLAVNLDLGFDPLILPKINAGINATVSVLLIAGFIFITNRQIVWHRRMMLSAYILSAVFLVSYVMYHLSVGHTPYCDEGLVSRSLYLFILGTHIMLSAVIVPLASFTVYRALSERFDQHRRLAKITWPVWLYVAVTGVLVYLLISPCY
ncbi:MAG: DUF420 domain-containing protein [Bacteroidia bacterium]|nr:DUF420 domain-containing protein [Bacteroidia bacterium]